MQNWKNSTSFELLGKITLTAILTKTMHKEEIIIGDGLSCRPKKGEIEKYQTDIITTRNFWKTDLESNYTLEKSPNVGLRYYVFIKQPVKFRLNSQFWLFYDCPKAFYEGYENDAEIEMARFCYGQITKLHSYDDTGAIIDFTIIKTLSLQNIIQLKEIRELPDFLADIFLQSIIKEDYAFKVIGKYYQLSTSFAQGNIGQFCIFTRHENLYTICLLGEWSLRDEWTFGVKYKLPESISKLIMKDK